MAEVVEFYTSIKGMGNQAQDAELAQFLDLGLVGLPHVYTWLELFNVQRSR